MTIIDLGEVTHGNSAPAIPIDYRRLLRALLAILSIAGLLTVAGSAGHTPLGLRPLWTAKFLRDDMMALDGETAYLSRLSSVSAYDLATGRQRWSVPTGAGGTDFAARPAGGLVLLPVDPVLVIHTDPDGNKYYYETARRTIAVSAATGEQRWQVAGDAQPSIPTGTATVAEHDKDNRVIGLRVVRLTDGAELWRRSLPPLAGWTPLPDLDHPDAIATLGVDGTVGVYGYADGRIRRTGRLPGGAQTTTMVAGAGPNLAVMRSGPTLDVITTVYGAGTLEPLWNSTYTITCGALVCSTGSDGVSGHDPSTGRVVWALPHVYDGYPVTGDRLLVGTAQGENQFQLIDSSTGELLGGPIVGLAASGMPWGGELLFTRQSDDPIGQLVVSRVDLATGKQTPLGRFGPSGELTNCYTSPGYLACPRYDGLHVMAVG